MARFWRAVAGVGQPGASHVIEGALREAGQPMVGRINRWFRGEWSDRDSLVDLLWRLELGDRCIAAGLWLHDLAVASGEWPALR